MRGNGSIYKRGAIYWIKYYHDAKCYRESSGSVKESEGRKLLRRRLGEIAAARFIGPAADKVTLRELAEDFENDYRINGRKSLGRAKRSVGALLDFFGGARAHDVTTDAIRKYIAKRLSQRFRIRGWKCLKNLRIPVYEKTWQILIGFLYLKTGGNSFRRKKGNASRQGVKLPQPQQG